MQLFEFFTELDQDRYNSDMDITVYEKSDTRKSKLTLEMLNQLRHHMQSRRQEKVKAMELYQKMYGGSVRDSAEVA